MLADILDFMSDGMMHLTCNKFLKNENPNRKSINDV